MEYGPGGVGQGEREGAGVELVRMLTIVKRALLNWKPAALLVALGISAGVGYAVLRKPAFRSETIVIYRSGVNLGDEQHGSNLTLGTRLQEMLMARSRLEIISDELAIYQDVKQKRGPIEAVEEFRKDITFKARSTDTFSISYKGGDPEKVMQVTQRLAQSLIDENQRLRVEQARVQSEFLEAEKARAESSLKEQERTLATFLSEHPEFALDQNASNFGVSVRAQREVEKTKGLGDSTTLALRRQAARLDAAISGETPAVLGPEPAADPELEAARQAAESRLASSKSDLAQKRSTFTDQHPDVIAAKARVTEAESALKSAEDKANASRIAKAAGQPAVDPETAKQRLKDKKRKIDSEISAREKDKDKDKEKDSSPAPGSEEATSIVGLETQWARLSRDVSEARDQAAQLERNYFRAQIEASSSLGGYSDQVVVLDPAYKPTRPEPPGKSLIVALAGGAAFVLAMIVAFLRALLDDHVYEEADLARVAPVLAVVPRGGARRWWRR